MLEQHIARLEGRIRELEHTSEPVNLHDPHAVIQQTAVAANEVNMQSPARGVQLSDPPAHTVKTLYALVIML